MRKTYKTQDSPQNNISTIDWISTLEMRFRQHDLTVFLTFLTRCQIWCFFVLLKSHQKINEFSAENSGPQNCTRKAYCINVHLRLKITFKLNCALIKKKILQCPSFSLQGSEDTYQQRADHLHQLLGESEGKVRSLVILINLAIIVR